MQEGRLPREGARTYGNGGCHFIQTARAAQVRKANGPLRWQPGNDPSKADRPTLFRCIQTLDGDLAFGSGTDVTAVPIAA